MRIANREHNAARIRSLAPVKAQAGSRRASLLLNLAIYQLGWFGTVLAASRGRTGLALALALAAVALHLLAARARRPEAIVVLAAGASGLVVDSLLVRLGFLSFAGESLVSGSAPPWIVAMWMKFAITFHFCLSWLSGRYLLASVLGAVGGPLSFAAGARFGAVEFGPPIEVSYAAVGLAWAIALPALIAIADRVKFPGGESGLYRLGQRAPRT